MDTKRLSSTLEQALSTQMNVELFQSHTYLSYGIWATDLGYDGIGNFFVPTFFGRKRSRDQIHAVYFEQRRKAYSNWLKRCR